MSFSNPAALIWAALAVPIVIFYILKIRMRRVPVSTTMFWQQVFDEKAPRSIWQQLRHLLSLLLQLLFLALLVFSLTDPFFNSDVRQQRRVIVVVDTSASMQAKLEDDTTRLDAAKQQIQKMIQSLKSRDEMAIIVAGNQAHVACGLTSHQRTLQNHLDNIKATDGPTQVADAVEVGRRLLADHAKGEVVVVSDGCFTEAVGIAADPKVVWAQIGEPADNLGLTRFQVRRSLLDPIGFQILVEVSNFSQTNADTSLDLNFNGELLDVIPLKLEPGEVWSRVFEKTSTGGGILLAAIAAEDQLPADNAAQAILPERLRIPVTLVTNGNWFLERVLAANDVVDLTVTSTIPTELPPGGVLVLHQTVPQKIPAGKVFVVQPTTSTDLWKTAGAVTEPLVAKQDKENDLMKYVRLDNVLMPEANVLQPKTEFKALVEAISGDPLYLHFARPEGDVIVLSVNLDQGDLPLRTAFPIMLTNALSWFADGKGELVEAIATGIVTDVSLPPELQLLAQQNSQKLALIAPSGSKTLINVEASVARIGPLAEAGIWTLGTPLTDEQLQAITQETADAQAAFPEFKIACNLNSPSESNLRPTQDIIPQQEALQAGFGGRPIWFYLVLVGFLLIMVEWFLFQRRWIS
ncbi:MAG: BatA and WFA domain-containing protein [Fuerstiella sp.]